MRQHLLRPSSRRPRASAPALAVAGLLLVACGSDDEPGSSDTTVPESAGLELLAAFYPLQFVAEQVGGDLVAVTNLTPAGAEPHDLELGPSDTARVQDADLVVYLAGFAPALDDAVRDVASGNSFDVTPAARLDLEGDDHDHDEDGHDEDGHDEGEVDHADDGHDEGDDHDHGGVDPHFWLDPTRLADVADALAARLGELAPDAAATFTQNAATLRAGLEELDGELASGLSTCASTSLVTSHEAFGYLAQRYGLTQIGISGLTPDHEPSPGTLAEVAEFVETNDVGTIYYETLVDPAIAETVASETGVDTAVLDPLEGLTSESAGSDYFEVMRANLATLRTGQGCT